MVASYAFSKHKKQTARSMALIFTQKTRMNHAFRSTFFKEIHEYKIHKMWLWVRFRLELYHLYFVPSVTTEALMKSRSKIALVGAFLFKSFISGWLT